uniref:transcobalamin-1-like n=1 Tax=Epinephelus lanceolatus TaxID=310571 RepID=UPI001445874E|nr:transcobalamin-1-like [Epinephelus lanceolatus]
MMAPALLSAVLLLLLLPAASADSSDPTNFTIMVTNAVTDSANQTYSTYVVYRGILLGGMRRLQDSNSGFIFTYTENLNYGPFLESVNGLAGNSEERTYWELLVQKPNSTVIRPDVGIGCYIPSANDKIILNFNRY